MTTKPAIGSPAGFWKRYLAYSIDVVLVSIALEVLTQPFLSGVDAGDAADLQAAMASLQAHEPMSPEQANQLTHMIALLWKLAVLSSLAYVAIAGAYFALCECSKWQATLGKRLVGIKVVAVDGSRIGPGRAFARFFAAALSWMTLNLGHAMAAIAPEHRALHDYLAGTRVENADPANPGMPAWGWIVIGLQALLLLFVVFGSAALVVYSLGQAAQV
jgi:uncharacterized RDD family membrane protein YckC